MSLLKNETNFTLEKLIIEEIDKEIKLKINKSRLQFFFSNKENIQDTLKKIKLKIRITLNETIKYRGKINLFTELDFSHNMIDIRINTKKLSLFSYESNYPIELIVF